MMAFKGVRSSWLIVARKPDLARFAASASSLARRSASYAASRSRCDAVEAAVEHREQRLRIDRFVEIIVGAAAQRRDRGLGIELGGHQHADQIRVVGAHPREQVDPRGRAEAQIDQRHRRSGPGAKRAGNRFHRRVGIADDDRPEPAQVEHVGERLGEIAVILDDQHIARGRQYGHAAALIAASSGSRMVTQVPRPTSLSIAMLPLWCETICLTVASPSPVPKLLVLNSGSKIRARRSAGMPGPVSVTESSSAPSSTGHHRDLLHRPGSSLERLGGVSIRAILALGAGGRGIDPNRGVADIELADQADSRGQTVLVQH